MSNQTQRRGQGVHVVIEVDIHHSRTEPDGGGKWVGGVYEGGRRLAIKVGMTVGVG